MSFSFALVALILKYLRDNLKTKTTMPELDKKILIGIYVSMGLFLASAASDNIIFTTIFNIVGFIALAGFLYFIYTEERLKSFKFMVIAIGPFLAVTFIEGIIKLISKSFYQGYNTFFESIQTFSVLWGLGVWLVTRKQQKELSSVRAKAAEEQENNKVITAMKAQLEVQVAERTAELTKQKEELELTLEELKSTQAQLIHSEKMASLGELTAGIAHEIQNPLNFINNFSEVNNELIEELKGEWQKDNGERDKALEDELLNDLISNNEKIAFHGKRADGIVKGMLQHSRKSSGTKEPVDINAVCDEYIRLSYHGLRAKDKSFNADFKTDLDQNIGKINAVPQDIGRVLLNLLNNAFYTVNEKYKTEAEKLKAEGNTQVAYKPVVQIQTKKCSGDEVEIKVMDNGNGIPQNIIEKVFQPFFTTKPTGEGTGLGLSLSYDIITKEHGGTINIESKEGEGTTFIIQLPVV